MSQKDVELILMRQCASHLSMAIFLVDRDGRLIYYNEPAEAILGRSFDDAGEMMVADLAELFETHDEGGQPIPSDQLPLGIAMAQRRPSFKRFRFKALDGAERFIEATALPLEGEGGLWLGSVAFFWETQPE